MHEEFNELHMYKSSSTYIIIQLMLPHTPLET
jgi:hypothetical protein